MKLMADVIDLAINKYLWDGTSEDNRAEARDYSCHAIVAAENNKTTNIIGFLISMGLDPDKKAELLLCCPRSFQPTNIC